MKRFKLVLLAAALAACGDSTGSGPSPWIGAWNVQLANGPGWIVSPSGVVVSVRDSAGEVWAALPQVYVSDSGYSDPVTFDPQAAAQNFATNRDSLLLVSHGQGSVTSFTYAVVLAGTAGNGSASGTVTVSSPSLSPIVVGTWTATKQ